LKDLKRKSKSLKPKVIRMMANLDNVVNKVGFRILRDQFKVHKCIDRMYKDMHAVIRELNKMNGVKHDD